jgi:hypothetical protein
MDPRACHDHFEDYLVVYLDGAGLRDDPKGAVPHDRARHRQIDAHRAAAGKRLRDDPLPRRGGRIGTKLGNHSFRATGIAAYLLPFSYDMKTASRRLRDAARKGSGRLNFT